MKWSVGTGAADVKCNVQLVAVVVALERPGTLLSLLRRSGRAGIDIVSA